jgi:GNAT superfamily N-acetyltransferase
MVALVETQRVQLERLQPLFWRKAPGSAATSRAWFGHLLQQPETVAFVAEGDGRLQGVIFARRTPAPPVYAPGETWTTDDFCVAEPAFWATVGRALLDTVAAHGRSAGWAQLIVVGVAGFPEQAAMLADAGIRVASTWGSMALAR